MKNKLITIFCVAFLAASSNTYAVGGGKKGPPAPQSKAWYEVVINWL